MKCIRVDYSCAIGSTFEDLLSSQWYYLGRLQNLLSVGPHQETHAAEYKPRDTILALLLDPSTSQFSKT